MSSDRHHCGSVSPASNHPPRDTSHELFKQRAKNGVEKRARVMKPKRQRLPAAPEGQNVRSQTFFFVDSTNSSSKAKRAHVMRRHIQEKRQQQQSSNVDAYSHGGQIVNELLPQRKPEIESDYEISNASKGRENESSTDDSSSYESVDFPQPEAALTLRTAASSRLASPVTILDASRKDPFHSLPKVYSRDDLELADYWTNRLSYWSGPNLHLKNQVFRTAMKHPLAFQAAILAYCARWKTQLYDLGDCIELHHHMGQVRRGVDEIRAGSVQIDGDSLAMAYSGLALQEERFGSREIAQDYVDQAVQVIRPGAGSRTSAEVYMHYVRYMVIPANPASDNGVRTWLSIFLRGAEELMAEHSTDTYRSAVPQRQAAFQMGSPLFPLLSSGPHPSQVPPNSRKYVLQNAPTQDVSRGAALIYITAVLWDFRHSPDKTSRFLSHLFELVQEHRLDRQPACETLVWLLLEETCDVDLRDPERAWSTGELLKMTKQLRSGLQFHFNEILMSCLQMMPPIPGPDVFERELHKCETGGNVSRNNR